MKVTISLSGFAVQKSEQGSLCSHGAWQRSLKRAQGSAQLAAPWHRGPHVPLHCSHSLPTPVHN